MSLFDLRSFLAGPALGGWDPHPARAWDALIPHSHRLRAEMLARAVFAAVADPSPTPWKVGDPSPDPWHAAFDDLRGAAHFDGTLVNLVEGPSRSDLTRAQAVRITSALVRLVDLYKPGPDDADPKGPAGPIAHLALILLAFGQELPEGMTRKAVMAKVKELI